MKYDRMQKYASLPLFGHFKEHIIFCWTFEQSEEPFGWVSGIFSQCVLFQC